MRKRSDHLINVILARPTVSYIAAVFKLEKSSGTSWERGAEIFRSPILLPEVFNYIGWPLPFGLVVYNIP